jgi:hypothetical protein
MRPPPFPIQPTNLDLSQTPQYHWLHLDLRNAGGATLMGRTLIYLAGGFAIVVVTFFITLKGLEYWSTPSGPDSGPIKVVEATYGADCQGAPSNTGSIITIKPGNATAVASKYCDMAKNKCSLVVDVGELGDPAPGCQKDFTISWRCGNETPLHQAHLDPEANSKSAVISCPAR